jgi:hypothetical protein
MRLGNPATGDEFFGRTEELSDLWRYLEADHIRFPGVRRLGKTSILKRLEEDAAEHGLMAKWLDVSGIDSAQGMVTLLDQAFPEKSISRFVSDRKREVSQWLSIVRKFEVGVKGVCFEFGGGAAMEWQTAAEKLYERLHNRPLLILLDEFPVMLEKLVQKDRQEVEQLLAWLRRWRQSHGICRFVFTGSIGLQSLLERHGLGETMNDCHSYLLGPYKVSEARGLWRYFAPMYDEIAWLVDDSVIDYALTALAGCRPIFSVCCSMKAFA